MTQDDFQKQVLDRLDALNNDVEQISKDNEKFSDRFTNYQQATQSLISRAFWLNWLCDSYHGCLRHI